MDFLTGFFIFLATYFGEVFGVMFGGGGFFIQPALLSAGIEPKAAVANDIAAAATAAVAFLAASKNRWTPEIKDTTLRIAPSVLIGAILGSYALTLIPSEIVKWIILIVCTVGFIYVATHFKKKIDVAVVGPIANWKIVLPIVGIALGFYDGFIGAGGGIIVIMALSLIMRAEMKTIIRMANWVGAISLTTAGIVYGIKGLLDPILLAIMVPTCLVAGFTGAKVVETLSEKTLRITYCFVVSALLLHLIYKEIWPLLVN